MSVNDEPLGGPTWQRMRRPLCAVAAGAIVAMLAPAGIFGLYLVAGYPASVFAFILGAIVLTCGLHELTRGVSPDVHVLGVALGLLTALVASGGGFIATLFVTFSHELCNVSGSRPSIIGLLTIWVLASIAMRWPRFIPFSWPLSVLAGYGTLLLATVIAVKTGPPADHHCST